METIIIIITTAVILMFIHVTIKQTLKPKFDLYRI